MTPPHVMARVQTSPVGAVLYDGSGGLDRVPEEWFEAAFWRGRGAVLAEAPGRGAVLFVRHGEEIWALRHYLRGGLVARFVEDHYFWLGLERTRAFREWRLLAELCERGLPVPRPVAARVQRRGLSYRSDLITAYLPNTRSLASVMSDAEPSAERWLDIGRMLRRFHDHGVQHPDLTAHNILLGADNKVFLVDFDNCRLRRPGPWSERGLSRLQRSLRKIALETGTSFDEQAWKVLESGYRGAPVHDERA
jgi:3-deoxy-D-manno-octulosonic acid kinase